MLTLPVLNQNVHLVEILLKAGADPNLKPDGDLSSPLVMAIRQRNADMCKVLLANGCDPNTSIKHPSGDALIESYSLLGSDFDMVVDTSTEYETEYEAETEMAIAMAAKQGNTKIMQLLVDAGADLVFYHPRVLDDAISRDDANILEYTLQHVYSKLGEKAGWTQDYIYQARQHTAFQCVVLLLRWGFFTHRSSSLLTGHGYSLFQTAFLAKDLELMNMLVKLKPQCLQESWYVDHANRSHVLFDSELIIARKQPPDLDILCRTKIIQQLGYNPMAKIQHLPLPNTIKGFVHIQFNNYRIYGF